MLLLDRLFPKSRRFGNMITCFDHQRTATVDQPAGAALVVRREVLDSVGALDERFTIYYNDVDWCFRIHRAGWRICFVHDAEIVHHQGVTTRNENRRMQLTAEMMRNQFDYYRKYFGERGLLWLRFWMGLGFSMRRVLFFLPDLLSSGEESRWRRRYHGGAIRAAVSGDANQFVDRENLEGDWMSARATNVQTGVPGSLKSATPDSAREESRLSTRDC
jgi:GT2 family glycosyltransferase